MTRPRTILGSLSSCVVLAAGLCSSAVPAQSPPVFRADFLAGAPGPVSSLTAVTDQGLVCGTLSMSGAGRAFVADADGFTLLPLPGDHTSSSAADVNEHGLVVGQAYGGGGFGQPVAVVWSPSPGGYSAQVMPSVSGQVADRAYGCNDLGDVVGRTHMGRPWAWNAVDGIVDLWVALGLGQQLQDVNESRVGVGGSLRVDLDDGGIEDLGVPVGTGSSYGWVVLSSINDAGTVGGYAHTATAQPNAFEAIRHHDLQGWKAFNIPIPQASALAIDAADDTLFQLFYDGSPYLHVDGLGSYVLETLIDPSTPGWDLTYGGVMSRSGRIAVLASNTLSDESGVVLLTRLPFVDLGGATPGLTGRPVLRGDGSLAPGGGVELELLNGRPAAAALLLVSVGAAPAPFKGGTLHANPAALQVWMSTDAQGRVQLPVTWPALPSGTELVLQFGLLDAASPYGAALSNGLSGTTPW